MPTAGDREFARSVHADFRRKPGSERIASVTALAYFSAVLRRYRPPVVLECGAGIGTMSFAMLQHEHQPRRIVLVEDNDFCLGEIAKNLGVAGGRYEVVSSPAALATLGLRADLIIGDGGWMSPEEYATVSAGTVVFVEGQRGEFRRRLISALQPRGLRVTMTNYCAQSRLKLIFTHRFVVPLPRKVMRVCVKKGCWIGQVVEGDSDRRPTLVDASQT